MRINRAPDLSLGGCAAGSVKSMGLKLDYLNFTVPCEYIRTVEQFLCGWLGPFQDRPVGIHSYEKSKQSLLGGIVAWSENGRKEAFVSLNGRALDQVPQEEQHGVLATLRECMGAKFTRVDCALDDYERVASMSTIHAAAECGNFEGFKLTQAITPVKGFGPRRQVIGDSRMFGRSGKAGSGKYLIIYDKALESKGQIDAIRYEVRFFKQFADMVVANLTEAEDFQSFKIRIGRAVGGCIDFVERGEQRNTDRMLRLDWWCRILEGIGVSVFKVPKIKPPLQKWVEYARVAVVPSLSLLREVVGSSDEHEFWDVLRQALDDAEMKINWKKIGARNLGVDMRRAMLGADPRELPPDEGGYGS